MPFALIEAKAEDKPPGRGLEQAKAYRERHNVPFVFTSNSHLFVEYDHFTGLTASPRPLTQLTNLLFFTKGRPTERTWYYDLSDIKVTKKKPLTLASFDDFFRLLPGRGDSERSWTVPRAELDRRNLDLKAVNPNWKHVADTRTPLDIIAEIEARGTEVHAAVAGCARC